MTDERYILFLAMGNYDIKALSIAKSYGYRTIAINISIDALCLQAADIGICEDSSKPEQIIKHIENLSETPNIVLCYACTDYMSSLQIISKHYNVQQYPLEIAEFCDKKDVMYQQLSGKYYLPEYSIIGNIHHFLEIPQDIYYFDRVPVEFNLQDLIWISSIAIIICFVSTLYPAWRASRLNPIEALRYE